MGRNKEILAAGYVRDILFRNSDQRDLYIYHLHHHKKQFKILEEYNREDGSVIIRVLEQYNNAPLIKLYAYE